MGWCGMRQRGENQHFRGADGISNRKTQHTGGRAGSAAAVREGQNADTLRRVVAEGAPKKEVTDEPRRGIDVYGPVGLRRLLWTMLKITDVHLEIDVRVHELVQPGVRAPRVSTLAMARRRRCFQTSNRGGQEHDLDVHDGGARLLRPLPHTVKRGGRQRAAQQPPKNRRTGAGTGAQWAVMPAADGGPSVAAAMLSHSVPCWGYAVTEPEQSGTLDAALCDEIGVPRGPERGLLKDGQSVTIKHPRTGAQKLVRPADVLGPPARGRRIVVLGDTCDSTDIAPLAQDCDVLVHEATHATRLEAQSRLFGHSTPRMAGRFARSVGARTLALTHYSARYADSSPSGGGETIDMLIREARGHVDSKRTRVVGARDFATLSVPTPRARDEGEVSVFTRREPLRGAAAMSAVEGG